MQGKRVYNTEPHKLQVGEYGLLPLDSKSFYARCPDGSLANLSAHAITEHEDGSITCVPSIKVSKGTQELWHGFLEKGIWRIA